MDMNTIVKLTKKIDVTDLSGEKVMVDFEQGKYFLIKGTGNDIWDLIQEETTIGNIVESLMEEYDVETETCHASVVSFLDRLAGAGLVTLEK